MKFEPLRAARRAWISGILVALAGIVLARAVAPHLEGKPAIIAKVAGQLLALGGLLVIALGIKRRMTDSDEAPPKP